MRVKNSFVAWAIKATMNCSVPNLTQAEDLLHIISHLSALISCHLSTVKITNKDEKMPQKLNVLPQ